MTEHPRGVLGSTVGENYGPLRAGQRRRGVRRFGRGWLGGGSPGSPRLSRTRLGDRLTSRICPRGSPRPEFGWSTSLPFPRKADRPRALRTFARVRPHRLRALARRSSSGPCGRKPGGPSGRGGGQPHRPVVDYPKGPRSCRTAQLGRRRDRFRCCGLHPRPLEIGRSAAQRPPDRTRVKTRAA